MEQSKIQTQLEFVLILNGCILFVFFCVLIFFLLKFRKRQARHKTELMKREIKIREKTLHQISLDLHDEVGSSLTGIRLFAQMAKQQVNSTSSQKLSDSLEKIDEYSNSVIEKTGDLVWMLKPENASSPKMVERLVQFAQSVTGAAGIIFECNQHPNFVLPVNELGYRRNVYLICKEAVNNSIKHSGCTQLCLGFENNIISITDNGNGFSKEDQLAGNGLTNMQLRAKELDIELSIQSEPGNGSCITLHL
jgi:signal transduction histidine kinase